MRGAGGFHFARFRRFRITPADAGSREAGRTRRPERWDHPRGCGEQAQLQTTFSDNVGSPPRMRGAERADARPAPRRRITPADAGSSLIGLLIRARARDHPRGCGEQPRTRPRKTLRSGSPPRMRGAVPLVIRALRGTRITPADAGSSYDKFVQLSRGRDHPRGCGEQFPQCMRTFQPPGSPPRMRGAGAHQIAHQSESGITPADAGSSREPRGFDHQCWDHPRGCGEQVRLSIPLAIRAGSPPRMRGAVVENF